MAKDGHQRVRTANEIYEDIQEGAVCSEKEMRSSERKWLITLDL